MQGHQIGLAHIRRINILARLDGRHGADAVAQDGGFFEIEGVAGALHLARQALLNGLRLAGQKLPRLIHKLGALGYLEVLPEWAAIAINASPIAYAVGIVENADKRATLIEGAEPEDIMAMDARLLPLAKANTPKLPFEQIDLLIVERIGKNISGTGMDTGVVGRADIRGRPSVDNPLIHKLAVLGLTPEAHGNGLGVGLADFMTQEVANSLDLYAMYMNSCTSTFTERVRLPIVLADDKAVIQAAVGTCWQLDGRDARLCIIRSTLHLDQILISPAMAGELGDKGEVVDTPQALEFDSAGHLLTRCPE